MAMALQLPTPTPTRLAVPTTLQVGSGKSWRADWLNLDVDPLWRPDFLFDLNTPLPADGQLPIATERFGELLLGADTFERIVAQDVLEHVRELPTAMTTLLHWLRPGGVLEVGVPYELSLGAWCDPTHVRAFNERSFLYYCEWSWYLGWRTHHFRVAKMEFTPSDLGRQLAANGADSAELLRTPRAIESMQVQLVKQPLDDEMRRVTAAWLDRPRR